MKAFALITLMLGFLLPPLGLVVGLVTVVQLWRRGGAGWVRVVAGAGLAAGATLCFSSFADYVNEDPADHTRSLLALEKGMCFNWRFPMHQGIKVYTVSCGRSHDGEVFATFDLADHDAKTDDFPGRDVLTATVEQRCARLRMPYMLDIWSIPQEVEFRFYTPGWRSWATGSRRASCVFKMEDGPLPKGSLRSDASTLDKHQLAYLTAENLSNRAYLRSPAVEYVGDDLAAYREWARVVAETVVKEEQRLREHEWPAAAERQVLALADQLVEAHAHWRQAARATDGESFKTHSYQGEELLGGEQAVEARKALGLAHEDAWSPGGIMLALRRGEV